MNNEQRILEALRANGPMDDDQLSERSRVTPRQQVNQICRRLAKKGWITRQAAPGGKIVNSLSENDSGEEAPVERPTVMRTPKAADPQLLAQSKIPRCDPARTLFIVPCSKTKCSGGYSPAARTGIVDQLPSALGRQLQEARNKVSVSANLDESLLLPASERYQGEFYIEARPALIAAQERGLHVLIISGGYGVLLPEEPIGIYDAKFSPSRWSPRELIGKILFSYAQRHGLHHLRAIFAQTSSYRKAVEELPWGEAGIHDAQLVTPRITGGGAQKKSPRAQAEAFCAALNGELKSDWCSRSGVHIDVIAL